MTTASPFNQRQMVADHLVRPLREGKPELGWGGDPALALAFHAIENRWELWLHDPVRGEPDRHVMIARGPVGQDINEAAINMLIVRLVSEMDNHARNQKDRDLHEQVTKHNARMEKDKADQFQNRIAEPLERFYHEAGRTLGVGKTQF